jgi:hypothetical protein
LCFESIIAAMSNASTITREKAAPTEVNTADPFSEL